MRSLSIVLAMVVAVGSAAADRDRVKALRDKAGGQAGTNPLGTGTAMPTSHAQPKVKPAPKAKVVRPLRPSIDARLRSGLSRLVLRAKTKLRPGMLELLGGEANLGDQHRQVMVRTGRPGTANQQWRSLILRRGQWTKVGTVGGSTFRGESYAASVRVKLAATGNEIEIERSYGDRPSEFKQLDVVPATGGQLRVTGTFKDAAFEQLVAAGSKSVAFDAADGTKIRFALRGTQVVGITTVETASIDPDTSRQISF